jgi:hypothetical protein
VRTGKLVHHGCRQEDWIQVAEDDDLAQDGQKGHGHGTIWSWIGCSGRSIGVLWALGSE